MWHGPALMLWLAMISYLPPIAVSRPVDSPVDQLWAEALWATLPFNADAAVDADNRFLQAAARARDSQRKADIYVSWGNQVGGIGIGLEMKQFVDNILQRAEQEFQDRFHPVWPLLQNFGPENGVPRNLIPFVEGAIRQAEATISTADFLDPMNGWLEKQQMTAQLCYLAAVQENRNCLRAWSRIAVTSKGALQHHALRQLVRRDPQNAHSYYLHAAVEVQQGHYEAALARIREGNFHPYRTWPDAFPVHFQLTFPDQEQFRKHDLVGRLVSPQSLQWLVSRYQRDFDWADSESRLMTELTYQITEYCAFKAQTGRVTEAVEDLAALQSMSFRLMLCEPADGALIMCGFLLYTEAVRVLKQFPAELQSPEVTTRWQHQREVCNHFQRDQLQALDQFKSLLKLAPAALRDELDLSAEEQRIWQELVRNAQLLQTEISK